MASLITVQLSKGVAPSLGFRLQGGKDFGTPLVIQKVNGGSPAEKAGLLAGDSVIKINNTDVFNLRHKDAQDVIVRSGPAFEITVQRGGSTWKPTVIPTGSFASPTPSIHNASPVTKTSLASTRNDNIGAIGTGHNLSAKPFSPQLNGAVNGSPKLVNNQYNSPLKLYSDQSIAETLSAQTEVLSTGALGVNFKKNEKNYDATNSAVFRMLQEAENEPKTPDAEPDSGVVSYPSAVVGLRHVTAPETRPTPPTPQLPPGQNICADCERLIVGVFVRIKDKNLHVECFKCATCGSSLKNVGYYNINNKLYCDVHAKLAARNNPPAPNLVPVTVPPGGKAPANAISAALSSHSLPSPSPLSPKSNLAQPFQQPFDDHRADLFKPLQLLKITSELNNNNKYNNVLNSTPISYEKYLTKAGNYSSPKPFSSVTAPSYNTLPKTAPLPSYNTLPKTAPLSPIAPAPASSFSPASSTDRSVNIVWPPPLEEPEVPTACPLYFPPPSQVKVRTLDETVFEDNQETEDEDFMAQFQQPKMSICSEEVSGIIDRRSAVDCLETISGSLETQRLVESVLKARPPSPPPLDQDVTVSEIKQASIVISSETREESKQKFLSSSELRESNQKAFSTFEVQDKTGASMRENQETVELKRLVDFSPNTIECQLKSQIENSVPKQWESSMVQALRTLPESKDPFTQIPSKHSSSALASGLTIAPSVPFTPQVPIWEAVPLPEMTEPYFPPEHPIVVEPKEPKPEKPDSEFVKALKTLPDRPFTPAGGTAPVKKKKDPFEAIFKDLPKVEKPLSMRDALTVASERPYTPVVVEEKKDETKKSETVGRNLEKPLKPPVLPNSFQQLFVEQKAPVSSYPLKFEEERQEEQIDVKKSTTVETRGGIIVEQQPQVPGMYPLFKGFSCSFDSKSEHSQFSVEITTSPPVPNEVPSVKLASNTEVTTVVEESHARESSSKETKIIEKQAEDVILKKPLPLASCLHKPEALPQYQVNLSENAEADLLLMKKIEAASVKHEEKKKSEAVRNPEITIQNAPPQNETVRKPIVTIQPGETRPEIEQTFKPVCDSRPQSSTFSPRPRAITPSMINKPPATLPYYQASLVAQHHLAAGVNLLDPTSPAISRSPSPCPEMRSHSPFRPASSSAVRPKSPAAGPPPNPLKSREPLPTPRDTRVEEAKKSVGSYIPQYQNRIQNVEQSTIGGQYSRNEMNVEEQCEQNFTACRSKTNNGAMQCQDLMKLKTAQVTVQRQEKLLTEDAKKVEEISKCTKEATVLVTSSQESHSQHLEQEHDNISVPNNGTKLERSEICLQINPPKVPVYNQVNVTIPFPSTSPQLDSKGSSPRSDYSSSSSGKNQNVEAARDKIISELRNVPSSALYSQVSKPPTNRIHHLGADLPDNLTFANNSPDNELIEAAKIPVCCHCNKQITRGPFITALGKIWCPEHFICATPSCRRPLQDLGFVEERGQLYCEYCFEQYLAPPCSKCNSKIKGDCLKAIGKNYHPECFNCVYCGKLFGNNPFFLEDGNPYCEADWNEMFTTKCYACGFPVEAGDRWVEALNNNYHSQCFNCTMCKKNLEGQSFFAKGGRPFCKNHAR